LGIFGYKGALIPIVGNRRFNIFTTITIHIHATESTFVGIFGTKSNRNFFLISTEIIKLAADTLNTG
jgi:hypothetical protein